MIAAWWSRFPAVPLLLLAPLVLSACASGNVLERVEADRSIVTGSVAPPPPAPTTDEAVIGAAVSSADPAAVGPEGIAWTNPATGAGGQITDIVEYEEGGALCRRFSVSRTRYDGIALLHGRMCLGAPGDPGGWQVPSLAASGVS